MLIGLARAASVCSRLWAVSHTLPCGPFLYLDALKGVRRLSLTTTTLLWLIYEMLAPDLTSMSGWSAHSKGGRSVLIGL